MSIDTAAILGWMEQASVIARGHFKQAIGRRKQDRTWVTEADLEIERFLVGKIRAAFPDHAILGEESGSHAGSADALWAIDPIDGTHSFMQGLPGWSISLGLVRGGLPELGFVAIPSSDEYYWVEPGQGALCNSKPIQARQSAPVTRGDWVATTSRSHQSFAISFPGKLRSYGSIATHLCYVARDAAVGCLLGGEGRGGLWDIAAGVAILRAAGGDLFTLDGAALPLAELSRPGFVEPHLIACAPSVVAQLLPHFTPLASA
jgi:myo-inositol-1(or 4)-monophosphatase